MCSLQTYGTVLQVSLKFISEYAKNLKVYLAQIPDLIILPASRRRRLPHPLLTRIRYTFTASVFALARESKLALRVLDLGRLDIALPNGEWGVVIPNVFKRLKNGPFGRGSIADLVVRICGLHHQIYQVLYHIWDGLAN